MTIGIVEDEEDLLDLLEFNLNKEGFDAVGFLNTKRVEQFIEEEEPVLLIMDRNLPDIEGSEFVKKLRNRGINIPVIYLSAKNSDENIIEGFESGGDDYITKPFNMKELIARVKAILKRTNSINELLTYKDISMNLSKREVFIGNKEIKLTRNEFDMLKIFLENKNIILTREMLIEKLWNGEYNEKSVNVSITRLKHKVGDIICSVRGIGYKLC